MPNHSSSAPSRGRRWAAVAAFGSVIGLAMLTLLSVSAAAVPAIPRAGPPPADDMVGHVVAYATSYDDTLLDLARANRLGFTEIVAANPGVDPWVPGDGTKILLPTGHLLPDAPREGIVINLAEHRLYYFASPGADPVTLPIGVGREGWDTPLGSTTVVRKKRHPVWYPPDSIREEKPDLPAFVPAGPDNPLGDHALYFGWPGYLVHGTNMPWGIGRRVSHGCIRLYPEDIAALFEQVAVGAPVHVIEQAVKIGWVDGELYIEAHPEPQQVDELERDGAIKSPSQTSTADVLFKIYQRANAAAVRLNWAAIRIALSERTGVPVRVTREKKSG